MMNMLSLGRLLSAFAVLLVVEQSGLARSERDEGAEGAVVMAGQPTTDTAAPNGEAGATATTATTATDGSGASGAARMPDFGEEAGSGPFGVLKASDQRLQTMVGAVTQHLATLKSHSEKLYKEMSTYKTNLNSLKDTLKTLLVNVRKLNAKEKEQLVLADQARLKPLDELTAAIAQGDATSGGGGDDDNRTEEQQRQDALLANDNRTSNQAVDDAVRSALAQPST